MVRSLDICHFDLGSGGGQKWLLFSHKSTIALSPCRAPKPESITMGVLRRYRFICSTRPYHYLLHRKANSRQELFPSAKTHRRRFLRDGRLTSP